VKAKGLSTAVAAHRSRIANTAVTFGINNIVDRRPPLSVDWFQTYDYSVGHFFVGFFFFQIEKNSNNIAKLP
jgi:hypothetical protein